jgi:choline dehydrogenase-like flavoprotein
MAYTLHEFGVTNGVEDGGFLIEAIFLPPFQFSLQVSISPEKHRELLERYRHMTMAFAFPRDHATGSISLTAEGEPRVRYALDQKGIEDVARGVEILARMWFKLGATRVVTSHRSQPILESEDEVPRLIQTIKREPKKLFLVSAHPQGGNRMGTNSRTSVVDPNGRVHGFENLFVSDASVFPTATGVNPQLTVMAISTILSRRIDEGCFRSAPRKSPGGSG